MPTIYSTYEAKAKFGEIIRKVRQGQRVLISYRGEQVAEVRPLSKGPSGVREALKDLEERGIISGQSKRVRELHRIARKPGALKRFLESRE